MGLLASLFGLALVQPAAAAPAEHLLPWGALGLIAAEDDAPAIGPDLLAASPGGAIALHNPATGELLRWPSLDALDAEGVAGARSIPAPGLDGLAFAGDVLLGLDDGARQLLAWDAAGRPLAPLPLPGLIAPGSTLAVQGGAIYAADVFGNLHPLARLSAQGLTALSGPALQPPAHDVRADAGAVWVDGRPLAVPGSLKLSGRVLDGATASWVITDAVVDDAPLRVERLAWPLAGGAALTLPDPAGRLYAPSADGAVAADGALLLLDPTPEGLWVLRLEVRP